VALAVVFQRDSLAAALDSLITGYAPSTGTAALDKLLTQGGLLAMMPPTLIALLAFAFGGLMQTAGLLEPLLAVLSRMAASVGGLIAAAVAACLLVSIVTGSSFLSILIPSELLLPAFYRLNLSGKNLSRTVDDAGTVVVPLIPWSIAGAFMSRTLGVPVVQYAPWAVFCYAGFLLALLYGFTGFAIAPRLRDDETVSGEPRQKALSPSAIGATSGSNRGY
jgi:NhaC family Na+:H+ antiporter